MDEKDIDDVETAWDFGLIGYFAIECLMGGEGEPYFIYGGPLLLKFGYDGVSSIPEWSNLPDLSLECWNSKSLSKIISKLPNGKVRLQKVIFEHAPKFCKSCNFFSYTTLGCNVKLN
ncbi:hypothetical protein ACJIZ3_019814 [Penstemon smallii]|uniref:Uncharacterized protein n=1 Tax=Penstemon smallii TaxID=265156 RepID=A0ABD3T2D5_9LAMI